MADEVENAIDENVQKITGPFKRVAGFVKGIGTTAIKYSSWIGLAGFAVGAFAPAAAMAASLSSVAPIITGADSGLQIFFNMASTVTQMVGAGYFHGTIPMISSLGDVAVTVKDAIVAAYG